VCSWYVAFTKHRIPCASHCPCLPPFAPHAAAIAQKQAALLDALRTTTSNITSSSSATTQPTRDVSAASTSTTTSPYSSSTSGAYGNSEYSTSSSVGAGFDSDSTASGGPAWRWQQSLAEAKERVRSQVCQSCSLPHCAIALRCFASLSRRGLFPCKCHCEPNTNSSGVIRGRGCVRRRLPHSGQGALRASVPRNPSCQRRRGSRLRLRPVWQRLRTGGSRATYPRCCVLWVHVNCTDEAHALL
jgi:hypothetical protein